MKQSGRLVWVIWGAVLLIALSAPWPYVLSAALFATFMTFAVLDEERDDESVARGARRGVDRS